MADRGISIAFGAVVRKHRQANGLSQEALAERADIHHTHVGLIERGERNASLDVAQRVAHALGFSLSALIGEAEKYRPGGDRGRLSPR
jgi:transcriptional regulator with XRE-family HTH domain